MALKLVDDKEEKPPVELPPEHRHDPEKLEKLKSHLVGTMSVAVRIGGGKTVTQADIERQLKNRSTL